MTSWMKPSAAKAASAPPEDSDLISLHKKCMYIRVHALLYFRSAGPIILRLALDSVAAESYTFILRKSCARKAENLCGSSTSVL